MPASQSQSNQTCFARLCTGSSITSQFSCSASIKSIDLRNFLSRVARVTDLAMPRREGIETIIEIRRRFPRVKVIALSGVFGGFYLGMARQLGASAALTKPVRTDVLRRTVDDVLAACGNLIHE